MKMSTIDVIDFSSSAMIRHPLRTGLILSAIAIGIAAIIILTGLGEGARRFVMSEFSSLGTNLLIVVPGKSETGGVIGLISGATTRDLTLNDANSLNRHSQIKRIAPIVIGAALVSYKQRSRETPVIGSTSELLALRSWKLARGSFLPASDINRGSAVCVIGPTIALELFAKSNPIGQHLRIGDRRFRVIGILASSGRSLDIDTQKIVIIPAVSAQSLFNTPSLFRILIQTRSSDVNDQVKQFALETIKARHQNEEDITIISQDALLSTFDKILTSLTLTVAGIGAISLGVAGILIMNIMLVSVSQRTAEIGLLKALGASGKQIQILFLTEAALLTCSGAALGIGIGIATNSIIHQFIPQLDNTAPLWAIITAFVVALFTGILFGALPAHHAAKLKPVQALVHR